MRFAERVRPCDRLDCVPRNLAAQDWLATFVERVAAIERAVADELLYVDPIQQRGGRRGLHYLDFGLRPGLVVIDVMPAKHLRIKLSPAIDRIGMRTIGCPKLGRERMARRPNSHQRFAGVQICPHRVHLGLGRKTPARAQDQQVGIFQRLGNSGKMIFVSGVFQHDSDVISLWFQVGMGKRRERFPGVVFIFANQHHDLWLFRRVCVGAQESQDDEKSDQPSMHAVLQLT